MWRSGPHQTTGHRLVILTQPQGRPNYKYANPFWSFQYKDFPNVSDGSDAPATTQATKTILEKVWKLRAGKG